MSKMKKAIIPVLAVVLAFAGDYLSVILYDLLPEFDSVFKNNIIQPVLIWLFTYGVMFIFGLIYYGRDKRLLRFPLAYAFGFAAQQLLWAFVKMIVGLINSFGTGEFIDTSYFYVAVFFIGAVVTLVTLLKSVRHEELFSKTHILQDGENSFASVRNRNIFGKNAYAKITVLVFGISFFAVRFSTAAGYYLSVNASTFDDAISLRADITDIAVCFVEIIVCYLISLGFCSSKKGAFYYLELFLFAGSVSSVFDGFSRCIISPLAQVLNMTQILYAANIFSYIHVVIGDIMAIIVSVLTVKWLLGKRKQNSI